MTEPSTEYRAYVAEPAPAATSPTTWNTYGYVPGATIPLPENNPSEPCASVTNGAVQSVGWPKPPMTSTLVTPSQSGVYVNVTGTKFDASGPFAPSTLASRLVPEFDP